jgi:hypothetical protein
MREPRLGDDIDDFCVRCKRIMNHAVVSVLNGEPAKVRCRTCHSDHDYRHEQAPPPKVDPRKAALFNEVLKKVSPEAATDGAAADAATEGAMADGAVADEAVGEAVAEIAADVAAQEGEAAAGAAAAAPKPKGRGRAKK